LKYNPITHTTHSQHPFSPTKKNKANNQTYHTHCRCYSQHHLASTTASYSSRNSHNSTHPQSPWASCQTEPDYPAQDPAKTHQQGAMTRAVQRPWEDSQTPDSGSGSDPDFDDSKPKLRPGPFPPSTELQERYYTWGIPHRQMIHLCHRTDRPRDRSRLQCDDFSQNSKSDRLSAS
jgi:hypothetical protein